MAREDSADILHDDGAPSRFPMCDERSLRCKLMKIFQFMQIAIQKCAIASDKSFRSLWGTASTEPVSSPHGEIRSKILFSAPGTSCEAGEPEWVSMTICKNCINLLGHGLQF